MRKKVLIFCTLSFLFFSVNAQDNTTGSTVASGTTVPATYKPKKVNVIVGNGYKIGSFTSTYGSNTLDEGDYKGLYFSVGFPINVNFRKFIGFTITPGIFSVNSEVKNPDYVATYDSRKEQYWQFDMMGINLPVGLKINLLKDFLYKGELSLVGGASFNLIMKARDENADMLSGTPSFAKYGYLGPDEKSSMGYFGGIQFSKNSGLLTIRYEDMGLNQYTRSRTGTQATEEKIAMKNTNITISYAILFGATKRVKAINQMRVKEGLQPLSEKRGIF